VFIYSSQSICQNITKENTRCFDSIQLKKIADIIFERDYNKALNEELYQINTNVSLDRDRLLQGLYVSQNSVSLKDSIIGIKDSKIILSENKIKEQEQKIKNRNNIIKGLSVISILILIFK
jgi:hypothetical protein